MAKGPASAWARWRGSVPTRSNHQALTKGAACFPPRPDGERVPDGRVRGRGTSAGARMARAITQRPGGLLPVHRPLLSAMLYASERSKTEPFGARPVFRPFRLLHLTAILGGATVRPNSTTCRSGRKEIAHTVFFVSVALAPAFVVGAADAGSSHPETAQAAVRLGEELFHREWVAGDARSPSGDGLGPVYNETSCVACHNLGGAGGAGPSTKNVVVLTAVSGRTTRESNTTNGPTDRKMGGHPGFETSTSVSLHRFGTDPDYEGWRSKLLGLKKLPPPRRISDERTGNQRFGADPIDVSVALDRESMTRIASRATPIRDGDVTATTSERNPTPLFGSGLINAIPAEIIEAVAKEQANSETSPEIHGRVSRLAGGRIGRFGWKGQTASLEDFVLTACAVELGTRVYPVTANFVGPAL